MWWPICCDNLAPGVLICRGSRSGQVKTAMEEEHIHLLFHMSFQFGRGIQEFPLPCYIVLQFYRLDDSSCHEVVSVYQIVLQNDWVQTLDPSTTIFPSEQAASFEKNAEIQASVWPLSLASCWDIWSRSFASALLFRGKLALAQRLRDGPLNQPPWKWKKLGKKRIYEYGPAKKW